MGENDYTSNQKCPTTGVQEVSVCLPVTIKPFAVTGPVSVDCCGEAQIDRSGRPCRGKVGATCMFTISQKLRIDVPVEFGANVKVGETFVDCMGAKDCDCVDEKEHGCGPFPFTKG